MNIPRKRSGSNSKRTKEKFEALFKNDESEEITENLWTEIIESSISLENFEIEIFKIIDVEKSAVVRKNLNVFIKECIKSLDSGEFKGVQVKVLEVNFFVFHLQRIQKRLQTP
jgi:hypothetical protein